MAAAHRPVASRGEEPELTASDLARELASLGVRPGGVLFVQASLRNLGPVCGGAATVVDALMEAVDAPDRGTLVAYTATPENSATSRLYIAATAGLSAEGIADYRDRMPPFDPATTPCSATMGVVSEKIRTRAGALRSSHPQTSFAALGPRAREITADHPLDCHLGERSALGRLYDLDAKVLLLGVPMSRFTSFHLADLRMPDIRHREYYCRVQEGWVAFKAPDLDDVHFAGLGEEVLRSATGITEGRVGGARCHLVPMREAVDLAVGIMRAGRASGRGA
ncbi:AAC(3) family N-acetyltransferase [Kitasatospora sp. NBC_00085]|uniref:aminoglycoside N(3)-acetyltransferase n=1 Tax=unclassified Kitasatospora TaxID=2633591 RepID=UPI00325578B0